MHPYFTCNKGETSVGALTTQLIRRPRCNLAVNGKASYHSWSSFHVRTSSTYDTYATIKLTRAPLELSISRNQILTARKTLHTVRTARNANHLHKL
jgi:hypothetical protein